MNTPRNTPQFCVVVLFIIPLYIRIPYIQHLFRKGTIFGTLLFCTCARKGWVLNARTKSKSTSQPPSEPTGSEIDGLSNLHTKAANKMPDTFYLVRANGTIGALTLRFPPQTSEDRRKRRAPQGWFSRWKRHRSGSYRGFSPIGIRRGLDCISWHTYSFADTFA